ncbi:MAG: hypothetical protein WCZ15_00215 [Patescibacteria group bacterium]
MSDKTKKQINESIKLDHIDLGLNADDLKKHAIEFWRLKCRLNKIGDKLTEVDKQAINGSMDRLGRIFDGRNLRIQDMTGARYNDGMNIEIIRAEKAEKKDEAKIIETLEPAIYIDEVLVNKSKVVIKK